ncbi:MAG: hypothetical protein ACFE9I_13620 [Candidatus Hermodarchaeota archaeon]
MRVIPNLRIDLNQTIRHRLIERHGPRIGLIITECIQECIAAGYKGNDLKDCIEKCLSDKLKEEDYKAIDIDDVFGLLGHWVTAG